MKKSAFLVLFFILFFCTLSLVCAITISDKPDISGSAISGHATQQQLAVSISVGGVSKWANVLSPEGIFEPENPSLSGTHVHTFSIKFVNLEIEPQYNLSCIIKQSNGTLIRINATNLNLAGMNYSLNYTVQSADSVVNDPNSHYLPWILKNCSITLGSSTIYSQNLTNRIYVHSPNYWGDNEVTRAVACEGTAGVYFNNTAKCSFSQDTLFALQMRNGNPVEESCFNNAGYNCLNDYCKGIFFPTCDSLNYFGGYSVLSDDPNGYTVFTASFGSYNTPIAYTRYTNTSTGTFKLRLNQALAGKTFSITIYNLTNVSGANVYGSNTGGGTFTVTNNGDGTFNVAHNRFSAFTGTLDLVFNISFNQIQNQDRNLKLVIAYGIDTNQGNPAIFPVTFSPAYGLYNNNENQSSSITTELNGPCGDNVNNDFDYLGGIWTNSYDCFDLDCNLKSGATQTNEFGSGKNGMCNYQTEINCTDKFDNDYDTILGTDYTDCHDSDCFHNSIKGCPVSETICNDGLNNDWDYTLGESENSASQKIENNGTKYDATHQADLIDCEDIDCDNSLGGTGYCNWGYERNCSDGFNNDVLQLKDCELTAVVNTITLPSPANAEYDCSQFCRQTTNKEQGSQCFDNIDNDWDAIKITGYYNDNYVGNNSHGLGIDCRWGGYFGIGIDYNPDEDCENQTNSQGKQCQLMRERNCSDEFDNDFDKDASGMPHAGWSSNSAAYQTYFNQTFVNYADYDDYDCKTGTKTPTTESLNASWCFDGIDNDLDAYYFNGAAYIQNLSTGKDCADPDCSGVVNPANPLQGCFASEYNPADSLLNDSARCSDTFDNDVNGLTDCSDLSCFKQFDLCSLGACKNEENVTWNSCADGLNNDYSGGIDCADANCMGMIGSLAGSLCSPIEICDDILDNNANGQSDCEDHPSCDNQIGGKVNGTNVLCKASESTLADCYDNFDNDADGKTDCYDDSCNAICNLATISGTSPIALPVMSSMSLNSVSDAYIQSYTVQVRKSEWYNITFKMDSMSTNAQWTLGTASKPFNKSAFDLSTASLSGANAGSFTITQTANGFVLNSNHASLLSGYTFSFLIRSNSTLASSTYEMTYAEEENSIISLNNYVYHEVDENIAPAAQLIKAIPENGALEYGQSVYLRANISDNNQLGLCSWKVYGTATFNPSDSNDCRASFTPSIEGIYYVNVTPKDYYSNVGTPLTKQFSLNIIPSSVSIVIDKSPPFYRPSETLRVNASFNVVSTDSLGNCEVIARNLSSEISLGTFAASLNNCYGYVSLGLLGDGEYNLFVRATENTEGDIVQGSSTALFVCSGLNGLCKFADFNLDGMTDSCPDIIPPNITIIYPAQNALFPAGTVSVIVNISTNENANCRYSIISGFNFSQGTLFTATGGLSHTTLIMGSNAGGTVHVYYKCNDSSGNINPSSLEHVFSFGFVTPGGGGGGQPPGGGGGIGAPCADDSYCSANLTCLSGVCKLLTCKEDTQCPEGYYCFKGNNCKKIKECKRDEQCPTGEYCYNGKSCKERECTIDSECPSGQYCYNFKECKPLQPASILPIQITAIVQQIIEFAAVILAFVLFVMAMQSSQILQGMINLLKTIINLLFVSREGVDKIKNLIKSRVNAGYSRERILDDFSRKGWTHNFINKTIDKYNK